MLSKRIGIDLGTANVLVYVKGEGIVIRPMKHGVIADYLITEAMLRHFIGKVVGRFNLIRPEVMICIPAGVTSVEQRAVRDAAEQAGARRPAHLVPEPLAAAIGAHLPVGTASGNMII